jgi:hypothetical protein
MSGRRRWDQVVARHDRARPRRAASGPAVARRATVGVRTVASGGRASEFRQRNAARGTHAVGKKLITSISVQARSRKLSNFRRCEGWLTEVTVNFRMVDLALES